MKTKLKTTMYLLIAILLIACTITACKPTPKEQVVVGKGEEEIQSMLDKAKSTPMPSAEGESLEPIAITYEAPEKMECSMSKNMSGVEVMVDVDAPIIVPQNAPPMVSVLPKDITYEQVAPVIDMLTGGCPLYHSDYSEIPRKSDIEEMINSYTEEIEASKDDPLCKDFVEDYKRFISKLIKQMENAPESYADVEAVCKSSLKEGEADSDEFGILRRKSDGMFVLLHDTKGEIKITKENINDLHNLVPDGEPGQRLVFNTKYESDFPQKFQFSKTHVSCIDSTKSPESPALTLEDALSKAKPIVDAVDPSLKLVDSCVAEIENYRIEKTSYGHVLIFGRNFNGVSINSTKPGFNASNIEPTSVLDDTYNKPYKQESLSIAVGDDGVALIEYLSPMEVKETLATEVELLPFDKIEQKFKDNIFNIADLEYTKEVYIKVDHVRLGMMRIARPNSKEFLVVPVWDFYGGSLSASRSTITDEDKNEIPRFYGDSLLTINAIDGSIIDREMGY